jgi:hypothetical protein
MNIEISLKEYERELNWDDGILYCQLLTIDDKNDWRLPTITELNYIYSSDNDFEKYSYWSYTESICDYACTKTFYDGVDYLRDNQHHHNLHMNKNNIILFVRPIRTI